MSKIDEINEMWSKDSAIDRTEPSMEIAKIPQLHAKYLKILNHHKSIVQKLSYDFKNLKGIKFKYYSGDLNNEEDLQKYNFEPLCKKILRNEVPIYLESDMELNTIAAKIDAHQEIVDTCSSILKEINSRTWQLKSIVDWEKFVGGQ